MRITMSFWNGVATALVLASVCCSPLIATHKSVWVSASQFFLGAGFIVLGASEDRLTKLLRALLACFGIFYIGVAIYRWAGIS
ncbi:hypothetical protein LMG24238_01097 [Paraburkholderia sediminicola]|uniref:Uncharacterized protein n=1 Tax=Paraburkholderia sediminicola TaxID=458836 RepID=A0A6J5A1T6_9BURK|nr:hypothetical protein LMG24238_01097 [Paraburkholderia sediminicola]